MHAHRVSETSLLSTHAAQRNFNPMRNRTWKIKNPSVVNPITGQPVSFKLVPLSSECHTPHPSFIRLPSCLPACLPLMSTLASQPYLPLA